ncbi:hypothetical protein F5883DRAFT_259217 [Diaporthe sp. PMI_573]|nr:hypothetical protein F5883DRAFT_259217 [Diaporthaceae sp. PMI_573]
MDTVWSATCWCCVILLCYATPCNADTCMFTGPKFATAASVNLPPSQLIHLAAEVSFVKLVLLWLSRISSRPLAARPDMSCMAEVLNAGCFVFGRRLSAGRCSQHQSLVHLST